MKQIYRRFIWASASILMLGLIVALGRAQNQGATATEQNAVIPGEAAPAEEGIVPLIVLPDLRVHSISAPSSASRGTAISVSDVTTNIGTANATSSTSKIYICTNPNNVGSGDLVASHAVAGIATGRSWAWAGSVTVPSSQPLGTNYYVVVANASHLVNELNYNNNTNYVMIIINP